MTNHNNKSGDLASELEKLQQLTQKRESLEQRLEKLQQRLDQSHQRLQLKLAQLEQLNKLDQLKKQAEFLQKQANLQSALGSGYPRRQSGPQ